MDWLAAHRVAQIAASQAHADLDTDTNLRIDVFQAVSEGGIKVVVRPMPRLFGLYIPSTQNGPAGILLTLILVRLHRDTRLPMS
jgi:hypothetical protein